MLLPIVEGGVKKRADILQLKNPAQRAHGRGNERRKNLFSGRPCVRRGDSGFVGKMTERGNLLTCEEKNRKKDERDGRFPVNLFCSLMLLSFIPFLYTLVRTALIADGPSADGLGIAGHIEWFDLINETIQAFLIVPLYALLNRCAEDRDRMKERIFQTFVTVNVIYILFSVFILVYCSRIVSAMASSQIGEVTGYLRLETVGFILGNVVSFVNVLFVVLEKPFYIYAMVFLKTVFTIIGDFVFIPALGVNGAACSNIAVNAVCVILCLVVVWREGLIAVSFRFDKSFLRSYAFIGLFSGAQILLDNVIYAAIVCKMVNQVEEQGNYWVANNIMWGLLLIPITALAEIIKKECGGRIILKKMKHYNFIIIAVFVLWLCFLPVLTPLLKHGMGIENHEAIKRILVILIPFYLAYSYTVLFDNILIGRGKTQYCFVTSVVVNLVYYPVVYGLMLKGAFLPDITFICMMFGFGMVAHLGCSVLCFLIYARGERIL